MVKARREKFLTKTENLTWCTDSFAFTASNTDLLVCLACGEKVANNKKSNVERHFLNKHNAFVKK